MNSPAIPSSFSTRTHNRGSWLLSSGMTAIVMCSVCLILLALNTTWAQELNPNSDAVVAAQPPSNVLIVQLKDPPVAAYSGGINGIGATQPPPGQRLNLNSAAAKAYAKFLAQEQQTFTKWLAQKFPAAQVVTQLQVVANAVAVVPNGATAAALAKGPFVATVDPSLSFHPSMDVSLGLINAPALWAQLGSQSNAGAGIKIGIVDTGIDQGHPFLTDGSLTPPPGFPKCDSRDSAVRIPDTNCLFTSNKVIVAKVFQTSTKFDAHAAQEHGSHVSGTAAGVAATCAPFVGCTMSGVAPKAFLGNYNVFPGDIVNSPDYVIARAVDEAVRDGMDVLNLSLGGAPAHRSDVLIVAVNNAAKAGVVVAVAAGNSGPGPGTVESPGVAENVITAGATTNPHFLGIPVTPNGIPTFGAALGAFANFGTLAGVTYATTTPANGCSAIAEDLTNKVALIPRGTCSFSTKIRNAQDAHAIGALISNNVLSDPSAMAQDGTPNQPTIPAAMVSKVNGAAMAANGIKTVDINGAAEQEFLTANEGSADFLASFSSRGPTAFTFQIKPDVDGPGVNVYSSVPTALCGSAPECPFAFFQGTSMATPHVAGSAALLRQLHPSWSVAQIKSALVNSAHRPVKNINSGAESVNPMDRGAGRLDLAAAGTVPVTFDPVSVSFGVFTGIPPVGFPETFNAQNVTGTAQQCNVVVTSPNSVIVSASPTNVSLDPGATKTVTLTLNAGTSPPGDYFGDVTVTCGNAAPLNVPWWVRLSSKH